MKTERMLKFEQELLNLVKKYTGLSNNKLLFQQLIIYSRSDETPRIEIDGLIF